MTKILITILLLIFPILCFAGEVEYNGEMITFDDELSHRDFTNWEFISRPEYDFSNKTIYSTVFTQENPTSVIFQEGAKNVTFVNCHLENVVLPEGSTVIAPDCDGAPCWTQAFEIQNDLRDWNINERGEPVKVLNEEIWVAKGVFIDPKKIPKEKIELKPDEKLEDKLKEVQTEVTDALTIP